MTPIKILASADLQLGYRQYGLAQREADFYEAARQVFEKAIEHQVDAILLSGDNFDATKPPGTAVLVMQELVRRANHHHIAVIGIDGNHDDCDSMWLRVCGIEPLQGAPITIRSRDGECSIRIAGINATRITEFYRQLAALKDKAPIQILAVHQSIAELSGFPTDFSALQLSTPLKELGVQYCAMGDIHQRGTTVINGVRFSYPGSTEVNDTNEDADKSVDMLLYDGTEILHGTIPITTRRFVIQTLESNEDVDTVVATANQPDRPFIVGWYRAEKREIGKRAEALLRGAGCMCRILPFSGTQGSLDIAQKTFERKGAMLQLKDAVTSFFDEGSEEFQLVFQLLGNPENTKDIAQSFIKSKE